jgi:deoxyhypusine synthase
MLFHCRVLLFLWDAYFNHLLIRKDLEIIVSMGACMVHMVHDATEGVGAAPLQGWLAVNDGELYKHNPFRVYDIFVPKEECAKLGFKLSEMWAYS